MGNGVRLGCGMGWGGVRNGGGWGMGWGGEWGEVRHRLFGPVKKVLSAIFFGLRMQVSGTHLSSLQTWRKRARPVMAAEEGPPGHDECALPWQQRTTSNAQQATSNNHQQATTTNNQQPTMLARSLAPSFARSLAKKRSHIACENVRRNARSV